ncbi:MAG: succinyl-diaminopimelate desuccinylase [Lysobacterales bacterium]
MTDAVLELTIELCRRASLTPDDAGCQALLAERLRGCGFTIETLRFGAVDNLWAWHGRGGPVFALLGHTDVVPAGDPDAWQSPPFMPSLRDGRLYARGAADMKGSVAAMVLALAEFVAADPEHPGVVGLLLTSDEEGVAEDGIRRVVDHFIASGRHIDYCLVGEPSSEAVLGDRIRCGRRGSLHGHLTVRGVQGHVAYPELALNPIHHAVPALAELAARQWDQGNAQFPPTRLQISNIHAGSGATNVIPAELRADFNFRFGTASRAEDLMQGVEAILVAANLDYRIRWVLSGAPFLTAAGRLLVAVKDSVRAHCGIEAHADTGGGTSDGRFVAPLGAEVIELGPVNASIHKIDEHVSIADLTRLQTIYQDVLRRVMLATA